MTKSALSVSLFTPESPEIEPLESAPFAAIVTWSPKALKLVTGLPNASCAVSVFVPVNATPFVCGPASANAKAASAPGVTVNAVASARVRAPSVKRSVLALEASSRRRLVKVATPATAALVRVPWRGPVPALSATVTVEVSLVTVLPYWSWIATAGCVVNAAPAVAPDGCVVTASPLAAAGFSVSVP